jgi:ribonucleoside-diphosphate reductase alpha chain
MMVNKDFVPNSPALMNAGTDVPMMSACFAFGMDDDIESILQVFHNAMVVMKYGGGVGIDYSNLRPKDDPIESTGGTSSGVVAFMEMFNQGVETIKSGGRRRGASIGSLDISHPDIEDFISSKLDEGKLTNMNISVRITDKFMRTVEDDAEWDLVFNGKVYKTIKARELFKKIVHGAWKYGEPGILFVDEIKRKEPYKGSKYKIGQNPCGETNLLTCPSGGESCILGSINVSNLYGATFNDYANITKQATHFLNNVIDKNFYPVPEIEDMTKGFRRIGIGIMGFADLLIKSGIPYDSPEALILAENIMSSINTASIKTSEELAEIYGTFPKFDECDIIKPRYNYSTTVIAPTGTISLLAGCSSGIEPIFSLVHKRYTWVDGEKVGYLQVHPIFEEKLDAYIKSHYEITKWDSMKKIVLNHAYEKGTIQDIEWLPKDFRELFKTSLDISPKAHIDMQAAFQKYTGNNISKTINLPNNTTEEEVWDIFFYGWKKHLKGMTVYRSGSRDIEVLELKKESTSTSTPTDGRILPKRDADLPATNSKRRSGCGKLIISVAEKDGKPYECIINNKGGCTAMNDALGQMISLSMRWNVPTWDIIKTLRNVTCPVAYKKFTEGKCDGKSCSDVVGRVIESLIPDKESEPTPIPRKVKVATEYNICPECGERMSMVEGCVTCACGYSRCG